MIRKSKRRAKFVEKIFLVDKLTIHLCASWVKISFEPDLSAFNDAKGRYAFQQLQYNNVSR